MYMKKSKTHKRAQVSKKLSVIPKFDVIKIAIDWHAAQYRVVRIIDQGGPEPAQRFTPAKFLEWAAKQQTLAAQVYSCYEAGAGGFVLHRQLTQLGLTNYVVHPRKLDPDHTGVINDATDARELAQNLDRYVRGNHKAMRVVFVPTSEQEQKRQQSRQRQQLRNTRLALAAMGRTLLLNQGHRQSNQWWKPTRWERLLPMVEEWMVERLETYREVILAITIQLEKVTQKIEAVAPFYRPKGMGALGFEEVQREVCDYHRFKNRKQPGSYTGLVGGVSASGGYHQDLPITKAGNVRLRTMLIQMAWRWVYYQPQSQLIQRWKHVLLNPKAHKRARKRAIVAVARRLLVDLWKWQTNRATPQGLGWKMIGSHPTQA